MRRIGGHQRFLNVFQFPLIFRYQNFNNSFGEFFALFARAARKIYTFLTSKDNFLIDFLISERIFHQMIFRSPNISPNLISTFLKLRKTFLKKTLVHSTPVDTPREEELLARLRDEIYSSQGESESDQP